MQSRMTQKMFIYELPYTERKSLCRMLDPTDKWEELGGEQMGFDYTYLQYIRRKDSPTDELLTSWGNQNHTVIDLFVLLSKMQHYRAMTLIKKYVPEKYHHLIREREELLSQPSGSKSAVDLGNLNRASLGQNAMGQFCVEQESSQGASRTALSTSKDNKDMGVDLRNLNLVEHKHEMKTTRKIVNEVKIQNVTKPRASQNVDRNFNSQNNISDCQYEAAYSPNLNPQPGTLKPGQERKLSNVSVTSSVMEGATPVISYQELETATNGWDTACILGRGGFGTVYKGIWKNTLVAIKKLESQKEHQMPSCEVNSSQMTQSLRELRYLNSHRHDNILSLYGFCVTDNVSCLVYQYMANGSLEDRLHCRQNSSPLDWAQRLNITMGTARGIQFLHSLGQTPLVHGDIKSANILLDGSYEPRLGDFGLAREGPAQQYTHVKVSRVHGTRPYLPDEFLRARKFSVKVDTYSFGVVLFEVSTGLRAYDDTRKEKFLKEHIVCFSGEPGCLADPLAGPDYCSSAAGLITLGRSCVRQRPKDRPDMKIVLNDVETLYNNYKGAERAKCLARQGSLTPTNPMERQIKYDELRNKSPQPSPQGSPMPQMILTPPLYQFSPPGLPEARHFGQGVGTVQVLPRTQTGLPQAIIIHHPPPPPSVAVQPPSTQLISPSQVDDTFNTPSLLDTGHIPLVTLLGIKPDAEKQATEPQPQVSSQVLTSATSEESVQSTSIVQLEMSLDSNASFLTRDITTNQPVPLIDSAYLPMIPDLLDIKSSNN